MTTHAKRIGILTAGGLAPCLSSSLASLIAHYDQQGGGVELIAYEQGYKGLLQGRSVQIDASMRAQAYLLHGFGGSPLGNSRVKLTNPEDCVKRALVKAGEDPREKAANQLAHDRIDVLHTIGGDDTNTEAARLAAFLGEKGHSLRVIGLPKTVDNDIYGVKQSLGAWTAAEEGARFFSNVVAEQSANPRMLIVHEVMGRNCGWLTANAAYAYLKMRDLMQFPSGYSLQSGQYGVHGLYVPELTVNWEAEVERLTKLMERYDGLNVFVSEGAQAQQIAQEREAAGETIPRDAFGHMKLDAVNAGAWFGDKLKKALGAEKVLVQKSGYFARAASANAQDQALIDASCKLAVECALHSDKQGLVAIDDAIEAATKPSLIEFSRIKGGKPMSLEDKALRSVQASLNA